MKKLIIISLLALVLAGCGVGEEPFSEFKNCKPALTNDEIIAETHKCEQAGLKAELRSFSSGYCTFNKLICFPRD